MAMSMRVARAVTRRQALVRPKLHTYTHHWLML